jgi:Mn2+/Fe2+ NRAMP family transporter
VNRTDLMGKHKNSRLANAIAVTTSVAMVVLTVAMVWTTLRGG